MERRSTKGWTWGAYSLSEENLTLNMDRHLGFKLNFKGLSHCFNPGKNEMALEFAPDESVSPGDAFLCEMRLHVPETAEGLNQHITSSPFFQASSGETIATIAEVPLHVPRGKYLLDMTDNYIKLHGKTNTFKINNTNITKCFLLPSADNLHISFVIGLDSPIRQGNTMYPFITLYFNKDTKTEIELNLPVDRVQTLFNDPTLTTKLEGSMFDLISRLFKALVKVQIVIPGSFRTANDEHSIACSVRANPGDLFLLQKSMIFIHKPVIFIPFGDIRYVEFARLSDKKNSTVKSFDIHVVTRDSTHQFTGVDRGEVKCIQTFFEGRKISIKKLLEEPQFLEPEVEDSEEDESFQEESEEDDSFHGTDDEDEEEDDDEEIQP